MSVSLKQIAEKAGVTKMTVSLALRNQPVLPEQTRLYIQQVAREMGYRPDPRISELMARLRTKQSSERRATLAVLWDWREDIDWKTHQGGDNEMIGIRQRCHELGFNLDEFWLGYKSINGAQINRILWSRGITGVIVMTLGYPHSSMEIDWKQFSAVTMGYTMRNPALSRIATDHFHAMMTIMQNLDKRGYRRIGLAISQQMDNRVENYWRAGYLSYHSLQEEKRPLPMLIEKNLQKERFVQWLEKHKPDVVIGGGDGDILTQYLQELNIRLPQDLGFVNCHLKAPFSNEISGMDHRDTDKGRAAVDMLVNQMNTGKTGIPDYPDILLLQARWIEGKTITRQKS